ncbi:MAG: phosphotransferase [Beggiatoa sp.]|nr:phosphotransferase [Beggiatoa sp.]
MEHEAFVYELVASRTNVPVPEVLFTDSSRQALDRSYLLMTRIDGEAVVSLRSLEEDDWRAIYRGMGEVLRALHEITFERFGYFMKGGFAESFQTNAEWMRKLFEQVLRAFAALGGPPSLERAVRSLIAGGEEVFDRCSTAVLCHNDFSEGNVCFFEGADGWRLTGVLDAGGATAGDPLFDLAKTDYWSTRGNQLKRHALFDGYGPTGPAREEALRLYRPYHALGLWNWFARDGRHPEMLARITEDLASLVKPA